MAHPALQDLYGATYFDEPFVNGVSRSFATYNPHAGRRWSVKKYVDIAPEPTHLPEHLRKAWVYYGIFPNMVIATTPETVQFYQEFPLSTSETLLRGAIYRYRTRAASRRRRAIWPSASTATPWPRTCSCRYGRTNRCCPTPSRLLSVRPRIWRAHPPRPSARSCCRWSGWNMRRRRRTCGTSTRRCCRGRQRFFRHAGAMNGCRISWNTGSASRRAACAASAGKPPSGPGRDAPRR